MPNILLTESCVRSCPYCFAKRYMTSAGDNRISRESLRYILAFLKRSHCTEVSYLGGEPTLHPEFVDFVSEALQQDFTVLVFTSGILSEATLAEAATRLRDVPVQRLAFVCNLNHPSLASGGELAAIERFLGVFGPKTTPGHTIFQVDFDLDFLFGYIAAHSLRKVVRLGFAHPIPGAGNACIPAARLSEAARRLVAFLPRFQALGIKIQLDCGIPRCLFNDSELDSLARLTAGWPVFACHPPIDIAPDLTVWACFPLADVGRKSLYEFASLTEIGPYFEMQWQSLRSRHGGVMESCPTCSLRRDRLCGGGCVAHLVEKELKGCIGASW